MRKLTLLALLTVVFLFLAQPILAGPYDDFPYYARIFVTENSGQDLQNYPLKIRVDWKLGMKADFSDLRFTYINSSTLEETPICYWIESYSEYSYADVWVFIPYIPANETVELKMYYGNEQAESQSNYDCVFQGILLIEDDFTTDQGWVFENKTEAEPGETVDAYGVLNTTLGQYELYLEGDPKDYETFYLRICKTLDILYDGTLNITVKYIHTYYGADEMTSRVWLDSDTVFSKDWYHEGTELQERNFEVTVSSGSRDFKIGFYFDGTQAISEGTYNMNITYVKVRLIPQVSPAPSYGISYPTVTYTPKPFTRTVSVAYPTHSITPYYFPAPPNVNLEEVRDVTVGGVISLGILLGLAIALTRAGAGILSIASAAGLVSIVGLLLNNTGVISVGAVVFLITISYYIARKKVV